MKRGFAVIGFSLLLGMLLSKAIGAVPSMILSTALLFCVFLFVAIKKEKYKTTYLAAFSFLAIGLIIFSFNNTFVIKNVTQLIGKTVTVSGTVIDSPSFENGKFSCKVKVDSVDSTLIDEKFKVIVTSTLPIEAHTNDGITATVKMADNSSYGSFGNGYFIRGKVVGDLSINRVDKKNLTSFISNLRIAIKENIKDILPDEEAGIIAGMVLGGDSLMSAEASNAFSDTGVYHLFAVSGLHVSLWSMLIFSLLQKMGLNRKIAGAAAIVFVLFYIALTAFPMSAVRAGIMTILMLVSQVFSKRADSLNSLGFAVFVILIFNPTAALSVSFLLTVTSALGIVTLGVWLGKRYAHAFDKFKLKKLFDAVFQSVSFSASLMLFTFPVFLIYFKKLIIISVITNIIFIPLGMFTIICGGLLSLTSFCPPISLAFGVVAGLSAKLMLWLANGFSTLPITSVGLADKYIAIFFAGVVAIIAVGILKGKPKFPFKVTAMACVCVLISSITVNSVINSNSVRIFVLSGGKSFSTIIEHCNKAIVIGCSDSYMAKNINSVMERYNVNSIKYLALPNFSGEVAGGTKDLISIEKPKNLLAPYVDSDISGEIESVITKSNISIALCDELSVKCKYENEQASYILTFYDVTILIEPKGINTFSNSFFENVPDIVISQKEKNIGTVNISCDFGIKTDFRNITAASNEYLISNIDNKKNISMRSESLWGQ